MLLSQQVPIVHALSISEFLVDTLDRRCTMWMSRRIRVHQVDGIDMRLPRFRIFLSRLDSFLTRPPLSRGFQYVNGISYWNSLCTLASPISLLLFSILLSLATVFDRSTSTAD